MEYSITVSSAIGNILLYFFAIPISIGSIVFLIQQTDFLYEYISLFCQIIKNKKIPNILKFEGYENSDSFKSYIYFLASIHGTKKSPIGFVLRLLSCFICLNCFLSVFAVLLITKNVLLIFPYFIISVITFFILFKIKNEIYKTL